MTDPAMNHDHDECVQALTYIHAFFADELPDADADQIRRHLDACEGCLESYEIERTITQLLKRSHPECPAPVSLRMRITTLTIRRT
ncbi:MAG: zf-HC2 domain-containing protein [Arachnia sp.]